MKAPPHWPTSAPFYCRNIRGRMFGVWLIEGHDVRGIIQSHAVAGDNGANAVLRQESLPFDRGLRLSPSSPSLSLCMLSQDILSYFYMLLSKCCHHSCINRSGFQVQIETTRPPNRNQHDSCFFFVGWLRLALFPWLKRRNGNSESLTIHNITAVQRYA